MRGLFYKACLSSESLRDWFAQLVTSFADQGSFRKLIIFTKEKDRPIHDLQVDWKVAAAVRDACLLVEPVRSLYDFHKAQSSDFCSKTEDIW